MSSSTVVINGALIYILAFTVLLFFLIVFFMIFFLVRYRRSRNPVPQEIGENRLLEVIWIVVPTLLVMTMFVYGLTGFNFLRSIPADSLKVKVHARQWAWIFEYENGKKSPDLIVPLGRNVRCDLVSEDVIHGFYIPSFRIQQDAVPGLKTQVWFNASTMGSFYILCSQYCGLKHSSMISKLIVVPPDQYEAWLKGAKIALAGNAQTANMPAGQLLLYERGCLSCHSLEGGSMAGPTFKGIFGSIVAVRTGGVSHTLAVDEDYIRKSITNPGADVVEGFPNIMPSGKEVLSDKEIDTVIQYLKTLK